MKINTSLRMRVAIGIALFAVLSLGLHNLLLFLSADRLEEELISQITTEEMEDFVARARRDPVSAPPKTENLRGYLVTDGTSREQLPETLRSLPVGEHDILFNGDEHHVVIRDEPEGQFILTYNKEYHERRERNLIMLLFFGIGSAALVMAAFAYWAAGLLVRPVRDLAHRVEQLGPGRPATPLALEFFEEEVKRLAHAFDGYLFRVADLMQREQEFTTNISHELRTPLTAIRTGCELLLLESELTENARRRIEAIDRATGRLAETARSLLFLARGTDAPRLEEISLQECMAEAAEPILPVLKNKGISFETAIDPSATVRADRTALFLVVDNLLRNAMYYTEHGRVCVAYRDGCLIIEDTGPGIDAAVLSHVGERFNRGMRSSGNDGLGLGLAIVKRICERFDWQIDISSATAGTRVTLRFPLPSSQNLHIASTIS